jgi:hypothetical protein
VSCLRRIGIINDTNVKTSELTTFPIPEAHTCIYFFFIPETV